MNYWITHQFRQDNYRGAERVFGWSFYSQGTSRDRQVSAYQFIDSALRFFGDPNPTEGRPWDKASRLAEFIKQYRTLLILDGLEPLQNPPGSEGGRIKDPALTTLIRNLASQNAGLCIVTTRLDVDDLKDFYDTSVRSVKLEDLSPEAGAKLLKNHGVNGTDDELNEVAREYKGHALALTLLGSYLRAIYKGDIHKRDKIKQLTNEQEQGKHARRVMAAYENYFKGKPELNTIYMLGLFDRPAEREAIEAVKTKPPIKGLTSKLTNLSDMEWKYTLRHLREAQLLAPEEESSPNTLDCHPLVREYFGHKLRISKPAAWKQAHNRLYEYYKTRAKEFPDTIEEMTPLYLSIMHGCYAERYKECLYEIYIHRVQRGDQFFSRRQLGAFVTDLAVLSSFFDPPWQQTTTGLTEEMKEYIYSEAGFYLRILGQLSESESLLLASLKLSEARRNWCIAARNAGNLGELYLPKGDISRAVNYAQRGVDFANRSDDDFRKMTNPTTLAHILHHIGLLEQAEKFFQQAEKIQKEHRSQPHLLYSVQGFRYCNMLLSQGRYQDVLNRAERTLRIVLEGSRNSHDIALDRLSLGRAYLLRAENRKSNFTQATKYLTQAVDGLKKSGEQIFININLLALAELHRYQRKYEQALADLEEGREIAERGQMNLYLADYELEAARICLAEGKTTEAREHLKEASKRVEKMGYHRRDPEVLLIQAELEIVESEKKIARETLKKAKKRIDEMGCHRWDIEVERLKELLNKSAKTK